MVAVQQHTVLAEEEGVVKKRGIHTRDRIVSGADEERAAKRMRSMGAEDDKVEDMFNSVIGRCGSKAFSEGASSACHAEGQSTFDAFSFDGDDFLGDGGDDFTPKKSAESPSTLSPSKPAESPATVTPKKQETPQTGDDGGKMPTGSAVKMTAEEFV